MGVAAALYLAAFAWSYSTLIAPIWGYAGLVDRPASGLSLFTGYVLAWAPVWFMPVAIRQPSHVVIWILYLWAYVPGSVMPYYVLSSATDHAALSATLVVSFAIVLAAQRLPRVAIGSPVVTRRAFLAVVGAMTLLALAFVGLTVGFQFDFPSFADVYDVRTEYLSRLRDVTPLAAYAVGWTANVLGPGLVAAGLAWRRPAITAGGLGAQVLIYGLTGLKTALLSTFLVVGLVFLLAGRRRHLAGVWLAIACAVLVAGITVLELSVGAGDLSSIFVRRLIAVPGWLFALYAEFFSTHPTYGLTHSVLGWFSDPPYALNPDGLIGYVYGGRTYGANAGVWADGMANFRLPGMLAFSVLLGLLLSVMDSVSFRRPLRVSGAVFGAASFSLVNSALFTSILSHGIAVALLVVWMLPAVRAGGEDGSSPPVTDDD